MNLEVAYFASGCFWCTEAIFQMINGVESVVSGYIGVNIVNPKYSEVCKGITGHAEGVKISFNSDIIDYEDLVYVFFLSHDPTTKDRQGNDVGSQYRSAIFYINQNQKNTLKLVLNKLIEDKMFINKIVTEIKSYMTFYSAEKNHQNYYNLNPEESYCSFVINPKLLSLKQKLKHLIKKN